MMKTEKDFILRYFAHFFFFENICKYTLKQLTGNKKKEIYFDPTNLIQQKDTNRQTQTYKQQT